jgi:hypothetical protein
MQYRPPKWDESMTIETTGAWDFFICHVREDKGTASSLAEALNTKGLKVWYSDYCVKLGDNLTATINYGLSRSRLGLVILSPEFLNQRWPQGQLNELATREVSGKKLILPIWHKISFRDVFDYSPVLADVVGISTSKGLDYAVQRIIDTAR